MSPPRFRAPYRRSSRDQLGVAQTKISTLERCRMKMFSSMGVIEHRQRRPWRRLVQNSRHWSGGMHRLIVRWAAAVPRWKRSHSDDLTVIIAAKERRDGYSEHQAGIKNWNGPHPRHHHMPLPPPTRETISVLIATQRGCETIGNLQFGPRANHINIQMSSISINGVTPVRRQSSASCRPRENRPVANTRRDEPGDEGSRGNSTVLVNG